MSKLNRYYILYIDELKVSIFVCMLRHKALAMARLVVRYGASSKQNIKTYLKPWGTLLLALPVDLDQCLKNHQQINGK